MSIDLADCPAVRPWCGELTFGRPYQTDGASEEVVISPDIRRNLEGRHADSHSDGQQEGAEKGSHVSWRSSLGATTHTTAQSPFE